MTCTRHAIAATAMALLANACSRPPSTNSDKPTSPPPEAGNSGSNSREPTPRLAAGTQSAALNSETIAPYLLKLTETEATICWVGREPSLGSVVVHGPLGTTTHTQAGKASRFHQVTLSDLQPGTPYRYEVGNNHRARFETVGEPSAFRVAVFGHTGGTDEPREYPVQLLASHLVALRPDVTLCTGDITYHSNIAGFRDTFFRPFSRFLEERPIYVAASNHDCGWPWLHGINYENARRLFPHDYASSKGAYYQFQYKNTRFFAVSYVQSPEDFRQQVEWLTQALDASTAEFNVVFMGGQSKSYYDKDYFFKELSTHAVDLVLGGDGGSKFQENNHGVPFFFAGDGGDKHHTFYWLSIKDYRFSVRLRDSVGNSRKDLWQFFSTRTKQPVLALEAKKVPSPPHVATFASIGVPSDSFDGLEFEVDWPLDQEVAIQIRWRPVSEVKLGGEGSYREQYLMLLPHSKQKMRMALPKNDYLTGEPYQLDWMQIQLVPQQAKKAKLTVEMAKHLSNVRLFRDS